MIETGRKDKARATKMIYNSSSQRGISGPPASPGDLLEMQILGSHPRPLESETLRWILICVLTSPPNDSDAPCTERVLRNKLLRKEKRKKTYIG